MTEVFDQDREFGIEGEPDAGIPGGGLAASGQVTMEKVSSSERVTMTSEDDGSDSDVGDVEEAE